MKTKTIYKKSCPQCGVLFQTKYGQKRFCSIFCRKKYEGKTKNTVDKPRYCKMCGKEFRIGEKQGNKLYCSNACAKFGSWNNIRKFHEKNPTKQSEYNKKRGRDTLTIRFFQKYPNIEKKCVVCEEMRVLDLHHLQKRHGKDRTMKNSKDIDVIVLCPTCHALIERDVYTLKELGLGRYELREIDKKDVDEKIDDTNQRTYKIY